MQSNQLIQSLLTLIFLVAVQSQQLQWVLLSEGTSMDTPSPRRDAALGYDQTFLLLFGGRSQNGVPLQDTYSFNLMTGQWDPITFPAPPAARYGMASANAINNGLYIFGGFGYQSSSFPTNPYSAYAAGQQEINYNYATPPNFVQNPVLMNNPDFVNNPNYNPLSGTGYNNIYQHNDDRADEMFFALGDAWFLNYQTKTWQQTQTSQHARGFGSATTPPNGASGVPKVVYSMGKSHDWMYSTVETIGEGNAGLSQTGTTQAAIIMYDLSSFSPSYPHARYGHSTALLTDNHLLLYGGCLSGYGKGGPCPSKDSWLLHIDRGHWERLGECPTTKTGAAMVALPSYSTCAGTDPNSNAGSISVSGNEPAVAVLWSGLEKNPSSIRTYPSPRDEVAVFDLDKKEWSLKRAAPYAGDGSYPMQREGAAFVAGCFQGSPGMFVFGGRGTADRRLLTDLWFLRASPQEALSSPTTRGCIYPFSFYHLHGIFQFFAYGVLFPIGFFVGRHVSESRVKRTVHISLQLFGIALSICGFSFGVHSVRAPYWLHFRHAHGIIGIITFILTFFQLVVGLVGAFFLPTRKTIKEGPGGSTYKINHDRYNEPKWAPEKGWRLIHFLLGSLVLLLGLINICLGVFLGVLPLPVWIIWYIYFGLLIIFLLIMEILRFLRNRGKSTRSTADKREDPKGASQASLKFQEDRAKSSVLPSSKRSSLSNLPPPLEPINRRTGSVGDDRAPLIPSQRQTRAGDVLGPATLPQYQRPNDREYPLPTRPRSKTGSSGDIGRYVGLSTESTQPLSRPTAQQQSEHNLTRVRLQ